jgi:hypothetical protein
MNREFQSQDSDAQMLADLRSQLSLNNELLGHLERESLHLRGPEATPSSEATEARRQMLPRLETALQRIRNHRAFWLSLSPEARTGRHELRNLLRQNQDLMMRMIMMDRENEQLLLRRGLIPPKHLPPVQRQRPHYVAGLYQRNHSTASPTPGTPHTGSGSTDPR